MVSKISISSLCLFLFSGAVGAVEYVGWYICAQGKTELTLSLELPKNSSLAKNFVSGTFSFKSPDGTTGAYRVNGFYDASDSLIGLTGTEWISRPNNYIMVGLSGRISSDNSIISGKVEHETCSNFRLEKSDYYTKPNIDTQKTKKSENDPFFLGFVDNKDGTVTDPRSGLMWKRCVEGMGFFNGKCNGPPKLVKGVDAKDIAKDSRFLGYSDWRLPRHSDYLSISAYSKDCYQISIQKLSMAIIVPVSSEENIHGRVFLLDKDPRPSNKYNDPHYEYNNKDYVGYVYEHCGVHESWSALQGSFYDIRNSGYVRLVRDSNALGGKVSLEFLNELKNKELEKERERIRAKSLEQEKEKSRRVTLDRLVAQGAQFLYLEAGKAQRQGSANIGGHVFYPDELYDLIINRFPQSEFAVKASDQLNSMGRNRAASNASNQAVSEMKKNSYQKCQLDVNSCYSRTGGKGSCYRDCESLLR